MPRPDKARKDRRRRYRGSAGRTDEDPTAGPAADEPLSALHFLKVGDGQDNPAAAAGPPFNNRHGPSAPALAELFVNGQVKPVSPGGDPSPLRAEGLHLPEEVFPLCLQTVLVLCPLGLHLGQPLAGLSQLGRGGLQRKHHLKHLVFQLALAGLKLKLFLVVAVQLFGVGYLSGIELVIQLPDLRPEVFDGDFEVSLTPLEVPELALPLGNLGPGLPEGGALGEAGLDLGQPGPQLIEPAVDLLELVKNKRPAHVHLELRLS